MKFFLSTVSFVQFTFAYIFTLVCGKIVLMWCTFIFKIYVLNTSFERCEKFVSCFTLNGIVIRKATLKYLKKNTYHLKYIKFLLKLHLFRNLFSKLSILKIELKKSLNSLIFEFGLCLG